jgi:hypothetical protein
MDLGSGRCNELGIFGRHDIHMKRRSEFSEHRPNQDPSLSLSWTSGLLGQVSLG